MNESETFSLASQEIYVFKLFLTNGYIISKINNIHIPEIKNPKLK